MALVATQDNTVASSKVARGTRTGTRTAADFTITCGFEPKYVKVTNVTDRISGEWFSDGSQLKTVAAGTRTAEDCGLSVSGRTFTVDVSVATLETDNDVCVWEAHG